MTLHEFNLWCQGRGDAQDRDVELLAWVVSNLAAAQGARIAVADLLGKEHKERRRKKAGRETSALVRNMDELRAHTRAVDLRKREAAWWQTEDGRRVQALLDADDEPPEE